LTRVSHPGLTDWPEWATLVSCLRDLRDKVMRCSSYLQIAFPQSPGSAVWEAILAVIWVHCLTDADQLHTVKTSARRSPHQHTAFLPITTAKSKSGTCALVTALPCYGALEIVVFDAAGPLPAW